MATSITNICNASSAMEPTRRNPSESRSEVDTCEWRIHNWIRWRHNPDLFARVARESAFQHPTNLLETRVSQRRQIGLPDMMEYALLPFELMGGHDLPNVPSNAQPFVIPEPADWEVLGERHIRDAYLNGFTYVVYPHICEVKFMVFLCGHIGDILVFRSAVINAPAMLVRPFSLTTKILHIQTPTIQSGSLELQASDLAGEHVWKCGYDVRQTLEGRQVLCHARSQLVKSGLIGANGDLALIYRSEIVCAHTVLWDPSWNNLPPAS